jgi:hypothetical protein
VDTVLKIKHKNYLAPPLTPLEKFWVQTWIETSVTALHHILDTYTQEIGAQCLHSVALLSFRLVMPGLLSFDVLRQYSTECKVWAEGGWAGHSQQPEADFCWWHGGKYGVSTFSSLTLPTVAASHCSPCRKLTLSLISSLWVVCHCNRIHSGTDDDVDK